MAPRLRDYRILVSLAAGAPFTQYRDHFLADPCISFHMMGHSWDGNRLGLALFPFEFVFID